MATNRLFVCDAYDAGFNINSFNTLKETGNNDLLLTRANTDYSAVDKNTLFSINGLIYPSLVKPEGILLVNAANPLDERVLLIRTNLLGDIDKVPITEAQLTNPYNVDLNTEQAIYLDVDFDLISNYHFLIIAGFLFIDDPRVEIINSNTLRIKQLSLDLEKKYLFSKNNYPINNINAENPNDWTINRSEFFSFNELKKLLSLGNSFVIYFNKNLNCRKVTLGSHRLPGRYDISEATDNLLMTGNGRVFNYRVGGNDYYPVIEGNNGISGLGRGFTNQNELWSIVDFDPPFKKDYTDVSRIFLEDF